MRSGMFAEEPKSYAKSAPLRIPKFQKLVTAVSSKPMIAVVRTEAQEKRDVQKGIRGALPVRPDSS